MVSLVASAVKKPKEDEAGGHRGVEYAKENQRRYHKGEGHLFENFVAKRSKSRSGVIVGTRVSYEFVSIQGVFEVQKHLCLP